MIIFFPQLGLPVAIMMPQMMIKTKDTIRMIVTSILVRLDINTGKAVSPVTDISSPSHTLVLADSIHLPINGIEVLSCIPQQTHFLLHGSQTLFIFLVHLGQTHLPRESITHHLGPSPYNPPAHKFDAKACSLVVEHTILLVKSSYLTTLHAFALQA